MFGVEFGSRYRARPSRGGCQVDPGCASNRAAACGPGYVCSCRELQRLIHNDRRTCRLNREGREARSGERHEPRASRAVSVNASVALRAPATVGLKTTLTVQLADTPRLVPHVLLDIA